MEWLIIAGPLFKGNILMGKSDALGSWGCGAFHGSKWIQLQWQQNSVQLNIMNKELIPIVVVTMLWDIAGLV